MFYPADLQFKPEDIPRLVAPILAGESDMVTGFKQGKYEKKFVSRYLQRAESRALPRAGQGPQLGEGVSARDHGRVARPAGLAPLHDRDRRGTRVHRHRDPGPALSASCGKSKFGIGRIPVGVLDMLSVWFELRFGPEAVAAVRHARARRCSRSACWPASSRSLGCCCLGVGTRPVWTIIQTCVIVGSVLLRDRLDRRADRRPARPSFASFARRVEEQSAPPND